VGARAREKKPKRSLLMAFSFNLLLCFHRQVSTRGTLTCSLAPTSRLPPLPALLWRPLSPLASSVRLAYQPPAISNQPTVLSFQNKPATRQQYFSLITNQHQQPVTSQTNSVQKSGSASFSDVKLRRVSANWASATTV
jgi:hypothetical protein